MCGIVGHVSYRGSVTHGEIQEMAKALVHRGPDDEGIYLNNELGRGREVEGERKPPFAGLGHRRLSIIDLSTGKQPIHNEDGRVWIVYNGETYNFKELRSELIACGHEFYTTTDTEIIVHMYEDYGNRCVDHLAGMFAFAIWDEKRAKLFLARDRMGEKPLYYYWDGEDIVFASELKGILAWPRFVRRLQVSGLVEYLRYGYVPDPLSIFENVFKLPPGNFLTLEKGEMRIERYWELEFSGQEGMDENELKEELFERLREAVRSRLVSDVPVGAFLSGGVDSSSVVALMAQEMKEPVKTFSIGFGEEDYNELPYAKKVAELFMTDHHELLITAKNFDLVEKIISQFDEPFGDASAIPTYFVSEFAAEYVKVVLSGDGGDEVFGGYDSYAVMLGRTRYERLPKNVLRWVGKLGQSLPDRMVGKRFLYNISLPLDSRYLDYISHVSSRKNRELLSDELLKYMEEEEKEFGVYGAYLEESEGLDPLSRLQYVDMQTYLPGDILVKVDRMSMAHSLETRVPMLDHELVAFVNGIPPGMKLRGEERKHILKGAMEKVVPPGVLRRKKHGFAVPLRLWFKGDLKAFIREILFEERSAQRGYFNKKYLEVLFKEYEEGRRDHSTLFWHLVVLELWQRMFLGN
jgi:asparagine synthase (glutamine-hydrolysing)